jgi:hypothetical protein
LSFQHGPGWTHQTDDNRLSPQTPSFQTRDGLPASTFARVPWMSVFDDDLLRIVNFMHQYDI